MSDNALEAVSEGTLEAIQKAQTAGIFEATGIFSYDLGPLVRLIPVVTPFRSIVPRVASTDGAKFAIWRAIMNVNNAQPRITPGMEYAGAQAVIAEQDFQAQYKPLALDGTVSQDAFDTARGYDDPYAEQTVNVLNQLLIGEDKVLIGGQSFALPQPATPTLTTQTTGGSIGATATVYVGVAARTGSGYFYGGNSRGASTSIVTGAGSTNQVTASLAAVKGAVAYDWFYSANGSTWFYVRTTSTASTVILATTASQGNPNANPNLLPGLSNVVPTYNGAADNGSFPLGGDGTPSEPDGLIATLTADYSATGTWVTPGAGTVNPAVYIDGGGSALTLSGGSVLQLTNLLAYSWNQVYSSPSALMMNAIQAQEIANLILGSGSATTFLNTDENGRVDAVAGGRVGHVVNVAAGGVTVPIEVHPNVPPGIIIARADRVPFPQANITNTLEVRTLRDYAQFDYAASRLAGTFNGGPRKDFEIRSLEAFVNRAPVTMGILVNVL